MKGSDDRPRQLGTVLIQMAIPDKVLARLRSGFPEVAFILPGVETGNGQEYSGAPGDPTADQLQAADGIISWRVTREMLDAAPRLVWIHAGGAGVNSYDLPAIRARGITLTNSSGVAAPNIAEHVMAMMLALARRIPRLVRSQRERTWRDGDTHREVAEVMGQELLIVGTGDIGRELATRAEAFGMRVNGVRRREGNVGIAGFRTIYGVGDLPLALAEADHVAITLPETPETRGLFDAAALAAMKPGAILYNVGRGPTVDTGALVAALASGHLGGAGLDVTDPEPLPVDSPLWEMENVLITSHTSGATPRYWDRLAPLIEENIRRIQRGQSPLNVVDTDAGY